MSGRYEWFGYAQVLLITFASVGLLYRFIRHLFDLSEIPLEQYAKIIFIGIFALMAVFVDHQVFQNSWLLSETIITQIIVSIWAIARVLTATYIRFVLEGQVAP